jgi:hypothetical protein
LSFLVFHQKKCSFGLKTYFCFPQKIHRLVSQIQNYRLVWGGAFFDPPHRNEKSNFTRIVVKRKETRHIFKNFLLISTLFIMGPLSDLPKKRRGTYIYILFSTIPLLNYSTAGHFRHSKQKKNKHCFFFFSWTNTTSNLTGSKIQRPRLCRQKTIYDFVKKSKAPL